MSAWAFAWSVAFMAGIGAQAALAEAPLRLEAAAGRVGQYEKVQCLIHLDRAYRNPFDPAEVDLSLEVQTPSGRRLAAPAFYCQPYERRTLGRLGRKADWLYPTGGPVWRARFAPMEMGVHTVVARLRDGQGSASSNAVTFECVPSPKRGYVRVSTSDPRFFEFTNGAPFFPIGQNLAFVGAPQYVSLARAEEIFGRMAKNGANYARVWACCGDWGMAVEARKSAWGRSWAWKPPFAPMPGSEGSGEKCVQLGGEFDGTLNVSPSHSVALRPNTAYIVSGQVRTEGSTGLRLEVNGAKVGESIVHDAKQPWTAFQREFVTGADTWWLEAMRFRVDGGKAWLRNLWLKEKNGAAELLWEADPNRPAMGTYNPVDCFMLDQLLEAAEEHGIYVQVCLLTRDLYMNSLRTAESPEYEQAIRSAKQTFRYAVARWGYSTSVATWEYWNEQNPGLPTDRFYAELGQYLEQVDVYRHLRNTSAWGPAPKDWRHPQLDVADLHWYLRPNWSELWKDEVAAVLDRAQLLRGQAANKPALLSEFGLADEKWKPSPYMKQDTELGHFHNALWASAFSGLSGTAMFWWWEQLDQMNAYHHYRPLSAFLADIPFTTAQLRPASAKASDERVRIIGLQAADRAYLWLFNSEATWWKLVADKATPASLENVRIEIEGLRPGVYRVQWWDTRAGNVTRRETLAAQDRGLRLTAPVFGRDLACKVEP